MNSKKSLSWHAYQLDAQVSVLLNLALGHRHRSLGQRPRNAFWSVCLLGVIIWTSPAFGQFKLDIERVADSAFPSEENNSAQQQANANAAAVRNFGFGDIDRFMFNRWGNKNAAKKAVTEQLKSAIETIERDCKLTDGQRAKLELAGELDMAHVFAEFDNIRSQFEFKDRNDINKLMQLVSPLQQKLRNGLFGAKSLLHRTSKTLLDDSQLAILEEKERKRLEYYFVAELKQTIARMERQAPLRRTQRENLLQLVDDLEGPLIMDRQYMRYFAMYSLAKLEPKLEEILTKQQLTAMRPTIKRGRSMEQTLKKRGMIE